MVGGPGGLDKEANPVEKSEGQGLAWHYGTADELGVGFWLASCCACKYSLIQCIHGRSKENSRAGFHKLESVKLL